MGTGTRDELRGTLERAERLERLATQLSRDDLVADLAAAAARVRRPSTVVAVVGQFKEGKSSLVNALVGADACPVDDDLATAALTLVHHGDQFSATVRRRDDEGAATAAGVELGDLRGIVTEAGNPENRLGIERVDLTVPSDLLASGVALVDTPGMGVVGAGQTAATLAFLPYVDGLVFVTDASAELNAREFELLERAAAVCPLVVICLTKVDLYPEWRRIAEIDVQHLAGRGLTMPVVPVSSVVANVARERGDGALLDESGLPDLLSHLDQEIVQRARALAAVRADEVSATVANELGHVIREELAVLDDPASSAAAAERFTAAQERLDRLANANARWRTVLNDHVSDLASATAHGLKAAIRDLLRDVEATLDGLSDPDDWDALTRSLQADVAELVAARWQAVDTGVDALRGAVAALFEEDLDLAGGRRDATLDVSAALPATTGAARREGGLALVGVLGRILPGAAAALIASNPILLGASVLLGGRHLVDQRQRKLAQQRQEARQAVRRYVEDVGFELGPQLTEAVREAHRGIRDAVTDAVAERQRTYRELATQAQRAAQDSEADRTDRRARLTQALADLQAATAELP